MELEAPLVFLDDAACDGQPEARTVLLGGDVGLEKTVFELGGYARPLVFNFGRNFFTRDDPHEDFTGAPDHRFFGVFDEVHEHLSQLVTVD